VSGGTSATAPYINQILYAGARPVSTNILDVTVSMTWLNGQGSSADDIEVTVSITVLPGIALSYPDGNPETIVPEEETAVRVDVAGTGVGSPVSSSGLIHYSINGSPFISDPMLETAPNEYEATVPAIGCDETIEYYFSAEEQTLGMVTDHENDPFIPLTANIIDTVFFDDFESDLGWISSGGLWARGTPNGLGGAYGYPDPSSAYSGSNVIGYNLNGDYTASMPQYHMSSPSFDCSGKENVVLRFQRWLGVEEPAYDHAYIRVSSNGLNWYTVWENDMTIADSSWTEMSVDISEYADNEATVYVRFTMGTSDNAWQFCGWNIDDLAVIGRNCDYTGISVVDTPLPEWTMDHPYSQTLSCVNQNGIVSWSDRYGDLAGTGLALSTDGDLTGTPTISGDIYFFALVIDETPDSTDRLFTLTINPAVDITTLSLDDGTQNEPYSSQLESVGGTGAIAWADLYGDLAGTGLTLSSTGLLSGTPLVDGVISFTAEITDDVGASDQQVLSADFSCCNLRGDVVEPSDNLVLVNDLVMLVDYIFKSGTPPSCLEEGDCADPLDGYILVNDLVWLVDYLFKSGPTPPAC